MAEVAGQERYSDWYYLKLVTDAVTEDGDSADNGTDTSITDQLSLGSCRGHSKKATWNKYCFRIVKVRILEYADDFQEFAVHIFSQAAKQY